MNGRTVAVLETLNESSARLARRMMLMDFAHPDFDRVQDELNALMKTHRAPMTKERLNWSIRQPLYLPDVQLSAVGVRLCHRLLDTMDVPSDGEVAVPTGFKGMVHPSQKVLVEPTDMAFEKDRVAAIAALREAIGLLLRGEVTVRSLTNVNPSGTSSQILTLDLNHTIGFKKP